MIIPQNMFAILKRTNQKLFPRSGTGVLALGLDAAGVGAQGELVDNPGPKTTYARASCSDIPSFRRVRARDLLLHAVLVQDVLYKQHIFVSKLYHVI